MTPLLAPHAPEAQPAGPYSLGRPASAVYSESEIRREQVIDRARDVAKVTIPSLVPPLGYQEGDKLFTPHQSIGSRGINNLAARLLLTFMPPERPLFKHEIPEALIDEFKAEDEEVLSKVTLALAKRALRFSSRLDTTDTRATLFEILRLLLVAGNCLWDWRVLDHPVVHQMSSYIVKRDAGGQQLLIILKQEVAWATLPEDVRRHLLTRDDYKEQLKKDEWNRTACVYTVQRLVPAASGKDADAVWETWQECGDKKIDGTEGKFARDVPPFWALWMVPSFGFDWGRSYADEYIGDLIAAENFSKAIQEGASAAALTLLFVKAGAPTKAADLKKADNLDVFVGSADDVSVFRTDKQGDFRFVTETIDAVINRLQYAFLLNSAIQRNGERVTAEEIRKMAQELEEALGGLYAVLASTVQAYLVKRGLWHMETSGELKKLPPVRGQEAVRVKINTGVDSLGQSREIEALDGLVGPLLEIPEAAARINIGDYIRRKAAALGIDPQGLVKTDAEFGEEKDQMRSDMQRKMLMEKGLGPAIQQLGGLAKEGMNPDAAVPDPSMLQNIDPDQAQAMMQQLQEQFAP